MGNASVTFWERFGQISDPRDPSGRRYPLQSVLELIAAGMLSGRTSLRAISRWGRALKRPQLALFNLRRQSPSQSTMHYLLQRVDPAEMERVMKGWISGTFFEKGFDEALWRARPAGPRPDADAPDGYASLRILHAFLTGLSESVRTLADDFARSGWRLPEWMRQEYLTRGIRMPDWFDADWKTPEWLSGDMKDLFENMRRMCLIFRREAMAWQEAEG